MILINFNSNFIQNLIFRLRVLLTIFFVFGLKLVLNKTFNWQKGHPP